MRRRALAERVDGDEQEDRGRDEPGRREAAARPPGGVAQRRAGADVGRLPNRRKRPTSVRSHARQRRQAADQHQRAGAEEPAGGRHRCRRGRAPRQATRAATGERPSSAAARAGRARDRRRGRAGQQLPRRRTAAARAPSARSPRPRRARPPSAPPASAQPSTCRRSSVVPTAPTHQVRRPNIISAAQPTASTAPSDAAGDRDHRAFDQEQPAHGRDRESGRAQHADLRQPLFDARAGRTAPPAAAPRPSERS